jgi:predicted transcriptional regulator
MEAPELKQLLDEHGISIVKVAALSGINYTTLYNVLNGKTKVKDEHIQACKNAVGLLTLEHYKDIEAHNFDMLYLVTKYIIIKVG